MNHPLRTQIPNQGMGALSSSSLLQQPYVWAVGLFVVFYAVNSSLEK